MGVKLDGQEIKTEKDFTIYELLQQEGKKFWLPFECLEAEWVNNDDCPLLRIAEVDGSICSAKVLKGKAVKDGMVINTKSSLVEKTLTERLECLRDRGECSIVRGIQELVAGEAAEGGLIDIEERAKWEFEPRISEPSIIHDPNQCVRCKSCIDICKSQGVEALSFDEVEGIILDDAKCARCGQCIHGCPMGFQEKIHRVFQDWMGCRMCSFARPLGAMREIDDTRKVWDILKDKDQYVVVQFAPAVRATLGEEFNMEPGVLVTNKMYAGLRRLGFDRIWDTNFTADLTIIEEGNELIKRVKEGGVLPQITSCSPGWIKFCETFYPDLIPNLSSAKSPQQMLGSCAKTYAAEKLGVDPRKMTVVSIMPCTAKKFEAKREEMCDAFKYWLEKDKVEEQEKFYDVDIVLTTRELGKLFKMGGINLGDMPDEEADPLVGQYTGAGTIFGKTGGVMEAALRTAYEVMTGKTLEVLEFEELGTMEGIKKATIPINDLNVKVAVAHGLGNAKIVCESIKNCGEFADYHFIEFMACPGGCLGGGGQSIMTNTLTRRMRAEALNRDDRGSAFRKSHENPEVTQIYSDFLKEPLSHLSHHLLHINYVDRSGDLNNEEK